MIIIPYYWDLFDIPQVWSWVLYMLCPSDCCFLFLPNLKNIDFIRPIDIVCELKKICHKITQNFRLGICNLSSCTKKALTIWNWIWSSILDFEQINNWEQWVCMSIFCEGDVLRYKRGVTRKSLKFFIVSLQLFIHATKYFIFLRLGWGSLQLVFHRSRSHLKAFSVNKVRQLNVKTKKNDCSVFLC